jgi:hypothetical protein
MLILAFGSCCRMAFLNAPTDRSPPPGSGSPGGAAGGQPAADGGGVAAVNDAQYLSGVGIDNRRHPWLDSPPAAVLMAEPAHPSVAVLIDSQTTHRQLIDLS